MIGGRNGEIAFLIAGAITKIFAVATAVPAAFLGIDEVVAGVLILIETCAIEDEKLSFGAKIGRVANAAVLQIKLSFSGDPARIAVVVLTCNRIDYVAGHH